MILNRTLGACSFFNGTKRKRPISEGQGEGGGVFPKSFLKGNYEIKGLCFTRDTISSLCAHEGFLIH